MAKHGTALGLSIAQFREFGAAVLRNIPDDLDPAFAQQLIERQDNLRDRLRQAFDRKVVLPTVRLLKTLTVTCEGKFTASQLIKQGKYTWVNPAITDELFPIHPHAPVTCELKLFQFDHNPSWAEVLAERTRRNLDKPSYEQGFYLGIKHPNEQRRYPIVVTHEPVRDPDGCPGVLVLNGNAGNRGLGLNDPDYGWNRDCVFAGVGKVAIY